MNDPFVPGVKLILFVEAGLLLFGLELFVYFSLSFIATNLLSWGPREQSAVQRVGSCGPVARSQRCQVLEAREQKPTLSMGARAGAGASTLASGSLSLSAHRRVEVNSEMKRKQSMDFVSSCGFRQHFLY